MLINTPRFQESLERAKSLDLEKTIQTLGAQENQRKGSKKAIEHRRDLLLRQVKDSQVARVRLERILQGNELTDITYLSQGLVCARSVCRIPVRRNGRLMWYGTGFLVAPGIVMTNQHVLPSVDYVKESVAEFRYERDLHGGDLEPSTFALKTTPEPILFADLDFVLVAVETRSTKGESFDQFGWLKLNALPGKAFIGEYLTIIQHPNGERKQICVRENKLIHYAESRPYLWYQTDTVGGSSGSPVFNNSWEVVAIHHSGVPRTKKAGGKDVWLAKNGKVWDASMGEDAIDWIANEGVRISRIAAYLNAEHASHPIAQAVKTAGEFRPDEMAPNAASVREGVQIQVGPNGNTRILVPIDIGVSVGASGLNGVHLSNTVTPPLTSAPIIVRAIEKVDIDQSNYNKRNGFDPKFLGAGMLVPLPKVKSAKFGSVLALNGKGSEIKYWNYSAVMNRSRRLAYFSVANVDAGRFRGKRDADGDTWYKDTRIGGDLQIGREFYKKQKTFEADRTQNPFDQGHLTRRRDLQWGTDDEEAKCNGDDSYHYTNCAPQHWQFNQDNLASGLWYRLEELAIQAASGNGKLCIINGPVFDAPLSTPGADGRLRLNVKGKPVKDGTFGGIQIPKQFFKVIAWRAGNSLRAKAFVVTQEDMLSTIDRYYPAEKKPSVLSDQEVRLYQVRIAQLEKLTGIDFGTLRNHDTPIGRESMFVEQGLPVSDEHDLSF